MTYIQCFYPLVVQKCKYDGQKLYIIILKKGNNYSFFLNGCQVKRDRKKSIKIQIFFAIYIHLFQFCIPIHFLSEILFDLIPWTENQTEIDIKFERSN